MSANTYWITLPAIIAVIASAMAALSTARNAGALAPEGARKLFHVAMGAMTLSFPWLFDDAIPVLVLAAVVCAWFEAAHRHAGLARRVGTVLSGTGRSGRAEIHYALGTAAAFVIAGGNALAFCLPMAILALADAAAALVGQRFSQWHGAIRIGSKTLAGSGAFFCVAAAVSATGFSLAGWPTAIAVMMALLLAFTTTVLEAVATHGADNLLIPVGAALLLRNAAAPALPPVLIAAALAAAAIAVAVASVASTRPLHKARS